MEIKACRICLNRDVTMYHGDKDLKAIYSQLINFKKYNDIQLPHYFCYECAALLKKYKKFRQKCFRSIRALQKTIRKYGVVTEENLHCIDREEYKLSSTYVAVNNVAVTQFTDDKCKGNSHHIETFNDVEKIESENECKKEEDTTECYDDMCNYVDINEDPIMDIDNDAKAPLHNIFVSDIDNKGAINLNSEADTRENMVCTTDKKCDKLDSKAETISVKEELCEEKSFADVDNIKRTRKKTRRKRKNHEIPLTGRFIDPTIDSEKWSLTKFTDEEAISFFYKKAEAPGFLKANFKCALCYKGFADKQKLDRHNKLSHNENYKQKCSICNVRKKFPSHISSHMLTHYDQYKCLQCDFITMTSCAARYHQLVHEKKGKTCTICGEEFHHVSSYYTHLRMRHRSEHVCVHCGKSFVSAQGLHSHKRLAHLPVPNLSVEETVPLPQEGLSNCVTGKEVFCAACDITFQTQQAYNQHMHTSVKHINSETELEGLNNTVGGRGRGSGIRRSSRYHKFERKQPNPKSGGTGSIRCTQGIKINTNTCSLCGKEFKTFRQVQQHHSTDHEGMPFNFLDRVVCDVCGQYVKCAYLPLHMNTHTHKRAYTCDICRKDFYQRSALLRHLLTHTGEKPYECTKCHKRYQQTVSLRLHERTAHLNLPYPQRRRRLNLISATVNFVSDSSKDKQAVMDSLQEN